MTPSRSACVSACGSTVSLNDLTVAAAYEALLRANGFDSTEALFGFSNGELLAKGGLSGWRERLRLTLVHEGKQKTLYLKRFVRPPARARRSVRRSGSGALSLAGTEWNWILRFRENGINCAGPVALGEEFHGRTEIRSALLTEAVPGQSLETWANRRDAGRAGDRATIRWLVAATADLIARMHGAGYMHRDLYLCHIFFDPEASPMRALHLIDLQRVLCPRTLRPRWVVKDLAALNYSAPRRLVSRGDRLRWLKRYLGLEKLNGPAKRLAYRVVGKTAQIARHDQRRNQRLAIAGHHPERMDG